MRREEHPLTDDIAKYGGGKIAVRTDGLGRGSIASRYPTWRARDGEYAIRDLGCPQFIRANDRAYPPFRVWTAEEYREWEKRND